MIRNGKIGKNFTIGVLGGMGTYATIHLFEQYAKVFPAQREWERPRIIIDNRCTMPSRVRALLYNEDVEQLVNEMSDSMQHLVKAGCNKIILACNTSHLFLPRIYETFPELEGKVIHIIDICVNVIKSDGIKSVYLLASEGTIDSQIYQNALQKANVNCMVPDSNEYDLLRTCIEAAKQDRHYDEVKDIFLNLVCRHDNCILGCTEFPILYKKYRSEIEGKNIYDPLLLGMQKLRKEYIDG